MPTLKTKKARRLGDTGLSEEVTEDNRTSQTHKTSTQLADRLLRRHALLLLQGVDVRSSSQHGLDNDAEILPEVRAIFEENVFVGRTKRSAVPANAGQFCSANVES